MTQRISMLTLAAALALSLAACTRLPSLDQPGKPVLVDRPRPAKVNRKTVEGDNRLSEKAVHGKEPKTILVAHDGSRCQVTEKRYRETAVGEKVWCVWQ